MKPQVLGRYLACVAVLAAGASALAGGTLTLTGPATVTQGTCNGYTTGLPQTSNKNVTITLSPTSANVRTFADAACSSDIANVTIPSGTLTKDFYVVDSAVETYTLRAMATGYTTKSLSVTSVAPSPTPTPVPSPTPYSATWTNKVNVTGTTTLTKSGGCDGCEDAGASSVEALSSGDGYMQYFASNSTTNSAAMNFAIGLNNGDTSTAVSDIKYGWHFTAPSGQAAFTADVVESGVVQTTLTNNSAAYFKVSVENGAVVYYKGTSPVYTSPVAPSYPLNVDMSLLNFNNYVMPATVSPTWH